MLSLNSTDILYWHISLHEKGSQLPGFGEKFGSTFFFTTPISAYPDGGMQTFDISQSHVTYLDESEARCNESATKSEITICADRYAKSRLECRLPWDQRDMFLIKTLSLAYKCWFLLDATKSHLV
jgi:hypothetical protein